MKKFICFSFFSIVITALIFFFIPTHVRAADKDLDSAYLHSFNRLTGNGYQKGLFLTREDFCAAISVIFSFGESENAETPFVDADKINPQNRGYLASLYEEGILAGYMNNSLLYMLPDFFITKQEALTMLGKILQKTSSSILSFEDVDSLSPYAYEYAAWFADQGILIADDKGMINPKDAATCEDLAAISIMAYEFLQYNSIEISTLAGTGDKGYTDGSVMEARFTLPYGVVYGYENKLIVLDTYNNAIRSISEGVADTITGWTGILDVYGFSKGYYLNDDLDSALFNRPTSGIVNTNGELLIADSANSVIRIVHGGEMGMANTFCGTNPGYKDGKPDEAQFDTPMAIAIDNNNNVYIADTLNNCIRKADANGNVTTIAGKPGEEGYADGTTTEALFYNPSGIAVNGSGNIIYIADTGNHVIRKIEGGVVTTLAGYVNEYDEDGNASGGYADGNASEAMFNLPMGIALADGYIIVADCANNRLRCITPEGKVLTIAGNGEPGDLNAGAMDSMFNQPCGICYHNGQLYIADTINNKIKVMAFDPDIYK